MGQRANCVIIQDGQHQIFFSRWGAVSIADLLLAGPDVTIALSSEGYPDENLLNDVWGEGGVLIDVDKRHLLFWSDYKIDEPYLRRPYLTVLRTLWPTWTVEWSTFKHVDLAQAIGWDEGRVLGLHEEVVSALRASADPLIQAKDLQTQSAAEGAQAFITLRTSMGDIFDYLSSSPTSSILSLGPHVITTLQDRQASETPHESAKLFAGAFIDVPNQTLWVWENSSLDPRYLVEIGRRWPGWAIQGHDSGIVHQVTLSGRDPSAIMIPAAQAVRKLIDDLTRDSAFNPAMLYQALTKDRPADQSITVGKGFFNDVQHPLSAEDRRDLLTRFFAPILAGQGPTSTP